jgi:uncharacterized repeat protein (TIGR03803 family)
MKFSDFAGSWFTVFVFSLATLFVATCPAQAQTGTVLYNFAGNPDGADPLSGLTFDGAGNLYGTTEQGGAHGAGAVFELSPNGGGGWNETVLYSFTGGADGRIPNGPVIFDSAGNLYGTAEYGGVYGYGVVFDLSPRGGRWTETVLYSFAGGADGGYPVSGLIFDPAGNLYGTSGRGVFELSPSGGGWKEQLIYAVGSIYGGLTMDVAGNIFGVGVSQVVYELSPDGNGGWNSTVIYTFPGHHRHFVASTPVLDKAGNLYGVTSGSGGAGKVYRLSVGKKGLTEKTLYSVKTGGYLSLGIVLDAEGSIYGATGVGGMYGAGTIFELVPSVGKGKYQEKVLWTFDGTDGELPVGSLILDNAGNLYGTTFGGGSYGDGVAFEVTP